MAIIVQSKSTYGVLICALELPTSQVASKSESLCRTGICQLRRFHKVPVKGRRSLIMIRPQIRRHECRYLDRLAIEPRFNDIAVNSKLDSPCRLDGMRASPVHHYHTPQGPHNDGRSLLMPSILGLVDHPKRANNPHPCGLEP